MEEKVPEERNKYQKALALIGVVGLDVVNTLPFHCRLQREEVDGPIIYPKTLGTK